MNTTENQIQLLSVDCGATNEQSFPALDCNGIVILPRFGAPMGGDLVESSAVARLLIRINDESNPWLPFSLVAGSGDLYQATGMIRQLWVRVLTPDNGKRIYFAVLKHFTFGGSGVSAGGTYAPTPEPTTQATSGSGTQTASPTTSGNNSYSSQTATRIYNGASNPVGSLPGNVY